MELTETDVRDIVRMLDKKKEIIFFISKIREKSSGTILLEGGDSACPYNEKIRIDQTLLTAIVGLYQAQIQSIDGWLKKKGVTVK